MAKVTKVTNKFERDFTEEIFTRTTTALKADREFHGHGNQVAQRFGDLIDIAVSFCQLSNLKQVLQSSSQIPISLSLSEDWNTLCEFRVLLFSGAPELEPLVVKGMVDSFRNIPESLCKSKQV